MKVKTSLDIPLQCPVCGSGFQVATKYKGWQLWQRWMHTIADLAAKSIRRADTVPRQLV